jgi:putative ABC transport system substrate-binding protein
MTESPSPLTMLFSRHTRRRTFMAGLGGAAAWPLAVWAQQPDRVRRIGVLVPGDDPVTKTWVYAFTQVLADLGWTDGRNMQMDLRWHDDDANRIRALAQELVNLHPDIILTGGTPATIAIQRETQRIPIVFAAVTDPVAQHIVARLDRPRGNVTGFANFEASLGGKWLELLSEIAPGLKRTAIMFNPDTAIASAYMPSLETAAPVTQGRTNYCARSQRPRDRNGHYGPWGRATGRSCRHAGCIHGRASRTDHIRGGPKQRSGGLWAI